MSAISVSVSQLVSCNILNWLHTWHGLNWKSVCSERVESGVRPLLFLFPVLTCRLVCHRLSRQSVSGQQGRQSVLSEDLRAGAKILNGDYHLALNNKCGKTVNKSHRKAAAAVRLTTAKTFTASFRSFAVFSREIWEWTTYWRSYNKLKSYTSNKLRSYLQQLNN